MTASKLTLFTGKRLRGYNCIDRVKLKMLSYRASICSQSLLLGLIPSVLVSAYHGVHSVMPCYHVTRSIAQHLLVSCTRRCVAYGTAANQLPIPGIMRVDDRNLALTLKPASYTTE
jgi:hypothetical protein